MEATLAGAAFLSDQKVSELEKIAHEEIEFMPEEFVSRMDGLLSKVGTRIIPELKQSNQGAPTNAAAIA